MFGEKKKRSIWIPWDIFHCVLIWTVCVSTYNCLVDDYVCWSLRLFFISLWLSLVYILLSSPLFFNFAGSSKNLMLMLIMKRITAKGNWIFRCHYCMNIHLFHHESRNRFMLILMNDAFMSYQRSISPFEFYCTYQFFPFLIHFPGFVRLYLPISAYPNGIPIWTQ